MSWLVAHYGVAKLLDLMRAYRAHYTDADVDALTPKLLRQVYGVTPGRGDRRGVGAARPVRPLTAGRRLRVDKPVDTRAAPRVCWTAWPTRDPRGPRHRRRALPRLRQAGVVRQRWPTSRPSSSCVGVPADQRFAAEVVGSDVDPGTYPGIYGVRPMQLSVPDGAGAGRTVPVAGLTWVGVHPDHRRRGPPDRDDAAPLRADPARGRPPLGAARQRAGDLRPARLRSRVPRAAGGARPRHDVRRAPPRRRGRSDHDPAPHDHRRGRDRAAAPQVDLDLLSECVGTHRRRRRLLRDARPPLGRGEARRRAAPDPVRGARRPRRRLRRVQAQAQVAQRPARRRGGRPAVLRWSRRAPGPGPTGRRPRPGRDDQGARRGRVRPAALVGAGSAWPRRRPPLRQPVGAPGGPAARRWPRAATRPTATWSSRSPTSPRPGTPVAGGSGSRTAPPT